MSAFVTRLKCVAASLLVLLTALITFGLFIGADAHLFENRLDGEVHVFFEDARTLALVVKGDNDSGASYVTGIERRTSPR